MSEAVAKATRREIRRAFGEKAVEEVTTIAGDVRREVGQTAQLQRGHAAQLDQLTARVTRLEGRHERWLAHTATVRGRLRWLLRGV